jgi:5-methyltetrahydropteroyltriglutamate--homocysteine methyltransferase
LRAFGALLPASPQTQKKLASAKPALESGVTMVLLPTMGVGSYASPSWLVAARERIRAGEFGTHDVEETFEDATRMAIADQVEAGLDIISDGELRRQRFVYEMFGRLSGLERVAPVRRVGVAGYDMAPHFVAVAPVTAPGGLGVVAEFEALRRLAPGLTLKVALPGPVTFLGPIEPGSAYGADGLARLLADLVRIVNAELRALARAGADRIQLDEPSLARLPHDLPLAAAVAAINGALANVPGRLAVHVCYGNNAGRPFAERSLARLLPALRTLQCAELVLEFANRELAEVERLRELADVCDIAAGVVDVKSFYVETPEDVAARIRRVLEFVPSARLSVTADCGFSALPRWLARAKLRALVAGARLVRAELG